MIPKSGKPPTTDYVKVVRETFAKKTKNHNRGKKSHSRSSVWFPESTLYDRSGPSNY
jgi:hypothetical protein